MSKTCTRFGSETRLTDSITYDFISISIHASISCAILMMGTHVLDETDAHFLRIFHIDAIFPGLSTINRMVPLFIRITLQHSQMVV